MFVFIFDTLLSKLLITVSITKSSNDHEKQSLTCKIAQQNC